MPYFMRTIAAVLAILSVASFANAQELHDGGSGYGAVTPALMADRREQSAREMSATHPAGIFARFALIDVAWPLEREDTGGYAIVLIDAQSQSADELPIRRVYVRNNDGGEIELRRVGAQQFTIPNDSAAHKTFGPFQETSFYWAPMDSLAAPGQILIDFATNRTGFTIAQLPFELPPWYRGSFSGEPNAAALGTLLAREYAGFAPH